MKIGIVGGSASGIYAALKIKTNHPEWEVTIFEHEKKLAKKLYATGNGHCNLLHEEPEPSAYTNPGIFAKAIAKYPYAVLENQLKDWGIALKKEGKLLYPASFSAPAYVHYLEMLLQEKGVEIYLETSVFEYSKKGDRIEAMTSSGVFVFDALLVCVGGKSGKNLGSDGSFFAVLQKHGYEICPLRPGLAPIKVKEKVTSLLGQRHHVSVSVSLKDASFHEEGELLFKKDGLSGIVMFNAESFLVSHNAPIGTPIEVNLYPEFSEEDLAKQWLEASKRPFYLDAYLSKEMQSYLKGLCSGGSNELAHLAQHLNFAFNGVYPFAESQVTIGGVSWKGVDPETLESKSERGVYFLGECLDIAGDCGGYNLTWCLLSAFLAAGAIV